MRKGGMEALGKGGWRPGERGARGLGERGTRGLVKTRSPQVLLGGPGGQGTRVEVSPDTSRA